MTSSTGRPSARAAMRRVSRSCPTIVGVTNHVIVADGIDGDGTEEGTQIYVLDPLSSGPDYWSFQKIEQQFELRANRELHMIQY